MFTKWLIPIVLFAACGAASAEDLFSGALSNCNIFPAVNDSSLVLRGQENSSRLDWLLPRSHLPLPLMKGLVEDLGVTLPLPLGATAISTEMNRTVAVADLRLGLNDNPPETLERFIVPETTFHASSAIGRVDLWLLPFLNVYGVVGHTTTSGQIKALVEDFPTRLSPSFEIPLNVVLRGPTYGFGTTFGIGTKRFFAMMDVNRSWTDFTDLNSELTATVVAPRFGLVVDRPWFTGEIHVGAMYQDTAQTINVLLHDPDIGDIHVEVDQVEPRPWNFLVGGLWGIDERLHLMVEGGMGGRSYIITGLTVRF